MVAVLETVEGAGPSRRTMEILQQAGMPGEARDHAWMAGKLDRIAAKLDAGRGRSDYVADLLISGLLLERGLDPSGCPHLVGREFPDHCLRAVPGLLKCGFPLRSWQLVESGVLVAEGRGWGGGERWAIQGQKLKPLLDTWHEMGEQMVLKHLAEGLRPLVSEAGDNLQIRLSGLDRGRARQWLMRLREWLPGERVHFFCGV